MSMRTSEQIAVFAHPFTLPGFETSQPAGKYRVVTDEEQIEGLSFVSFRRIATTMHLPAIGKRSATMQAYPIDPAELTEALRADALR